MPSRSKHLCTAQLIHQKPHSDNPPQKAGPRQHSRILSATEQDIANHLADRRGFPQPDSQRQFHEIGNPVTDYVLWVQTATPEDPQSRRGVHQTLQFETAIPAERVTSSRAYNYLQERRRVPENVRCSRWFAKRNLSRIKGVNA